MGTSYYVDYNYVVSRRYINNNDTTFVYFRTGYSGADYSATGVEVTLDGDWYEIDVDADTSVSSISSFNLKLYEGKIVTRSAGAAAPAGTGKRIKLRKS